MLDINDPRVVPLTPEQAAVLAICTASISKHLTDDGMPSAEAVLAYLLGNGMDSAACGLVTSVAEGPAALQTWARNIRVNLTSPGLAPTHPIRTEQQMGTTDLTGAVAHLICLEGEEPAVLFLAAQEKRNAAIKADAAARATAHRFTPTPDRLIQEAIDCVGGPIAWSRLSLEGQLVIVRSRAWVEIQNAVRPGATLCDVSGILTAMEDVYSRRVLP